MSEHLLSDQRALPRFKLLECIGTSQAETWLAENRTSGEKVIVKIYRLGQAADWKGLDLFRREINALKQLTHPGIPRYLDDREVEVDGQLHVYLVQEYVVGNTLESFMKAPANICADDLHNLAAGVLEILAYLQSFSPPIIHRDLKPTNIMVDERGRAHLVDFGAVQLVTPADEGGSTIVGTSGYMPYEQLMGRASTASDLYGLGMTLVALITRVPPVTLPVVEMRTVWEDHIIIPIPDAFKHFVNQLIQPIAEDRYPDAAKALRALNPSVSMALVAPPPEDMKVTIVQNGDELRLIVPPHSRVPLVALGVFVIGCAMGLVWEDEGHWGVIVAMGVVTAMAAAYLLYKELRRPTEIRILPDRWDIYSKKTLIASGPHKDLMGVGRRKNKRNEVCMTLVTSEATLFFPTHISEEEERWLNTNIQTFITDNRN